VLRLAAMPVLNVLDIAAGVLLAAGLLFGVVYGFRQNDRGILIGFGIMAASLICWRVVVWRDVDLEARATEPVDLYAKYGLERPHQ
jgi:hypothetical protein